MPVSQYLPFPSIKGTEGKSRKGGNGCGRIKGFRKGPPCKTLCDPEPPFQGSGTTLSKIREAMPRAVLGRPVGAEEPRPEAGGIRA
jgi:hypothetical protein